MVEREHSYDGTSEETRQRFHNAKASILANVVSTGEDKCWIWTGSAIATNSNYPEYLMPRIMSHDPLIDGMRRPTYAHRISYQVFIGPIPEGAIVFRTCRNVLCVNPKHLTAVPRSESSRRTRLANPGQRRRRRVDRRPRKPKAPSPSKTALTYCLAGHPLAGDNVEVLESGLVRCKVCDTVWLT